MSQMVFSREFLLNTLMLPYAFLQRQFTSSARPPYYMPSERSPHLRTLMAWPDQSSTRNIADLFSAQKEVASIANAIAKHEPVWMYTKPAECRIAADFVNTNVMITPLDVSELWIRDTGPVFVNSANGEKQLGIDFGFNYWGNKFDLHRDQSVARKLLAERRMNRLQAPIVLEGGGIEVDGQGTLLATESSIINENRNPGKNRTTIEQELRNLLGVEKIIWLPDYHIDSLARFGPDSRTIILSRPNDAIPHDHPTYIVYDQSHAILSAATNAAGQRYRIIEIEEALTVPRVSNRPKEQTTVLPEDNWLPATSYVNFYTPNGAIVVPQFGEERTDQEAVDVLQRLFPERAVEKVVLDWMAYAGGGPHCATQQWPVLGRRGG
ncbi:uncharacterized protein LTR77_009996 [Saxophila tyrrhenica]|uniref:Agmatine deiminase n=1 Tax=Saxophila tyrrhenica TaxID=1690608 RepID=A0AAV9NWM0_9PEZI|nr:hypothetical protein LTR77_009996 [Saxophila tyrrhenica]